MWRGQTAACFGNRSYSLTEDHTNKKCEVVESECSCHYYFQLHYKHNYTIEVKNGLILIMKKNHILEQERDKVRIFSY